MALHQTRPVDLEGWRGERVDWIDRIRGLAIVLMILDHTLLFLAPVSPLRFTLTRLSLPLFMCAAAAVWRPGVRTGRMVLLGVSVVFELIVSDVVPIGMPGILLVYLVAIVPLSQFERAGHHAYLIGVLGLVQALYLPIGWAGYEPGLVILWWCLGRLGSYQLDQIGRRLPSSFALAGRHPLGWYCGHLGVLAGLASVVVL